MTVNPSTSPFSLSSPLLLNSTSLISGVQHLSLSPSSTSSFSWADRVRGSQAPKQTSQAPQEMSTVRCIRIIKNVHQDDIHSMIRLHDNTLITGSKDGSLKKWTLEGKLHKEIHRLNDINYKKWITAIAVINENYWISGNREGSIHLWDNTGNHVKDTRASPQIKQSKPSHTCKMRNLNRVNCLTSFEEITGKPHFLAGWPTQFTLHSYNPCRRIEHICTNRNDWVYAIQPITEKALLVVTGCRLDLYTKNRDWSYNCAIITEDTSIQPRPYLSAITPLRNSTENYGLAVFDGSVRVIHLESKKTIFNQQEHENRVWTIENISENCFASCGDDGFIKFWDIRQKHSVYTLKDNNEEKARVSVLLQLSNEELLSGSCPDDVKNSEDKARFSFLDIRNLRS